MKSVFYCVGKKRYLFNSKFLMQKERITLKKLINVKKSALNKVLNLIKFCLSFNS